MYRLYKNSESDHTGGAKIGVSRCSLEKNAVPPAASEGSECQVASGMKVRKD
jgi:hypothetical protein